MPAELRAIQSQRMVLTRQLQQSIELLQLPTADLLTEISRALEENPLLEMPEEEGPAEDREPEAPAMPRAEPPATVSAREDAEEESLASQARGADQGAGGAEIDLAAQSWGSPEPEDDFSPVDRAVSQESLADHLIEELGFERIAPEIEAKAAFLIGELDDDGFLPVPLEEAARDFERLTGTEPAPEAEWREALRVLQGLDPAGVGASSPQESLLLQLDDLLRDAASPEERRVPELAKRVIAEALSDLARKDFAKIRRLLDCSEDEVKAVCGCILSLSPRPASRYKTAPTLYVIPDVFVTLSGGRWRARLNPATAPGIRVNPELAALLAAHRGERSKEMTGRLAEAKAFTHSIEQRYDTILRVAGSIVERQQAFFDRGEIALAPMVLKDIADDTGLHESTVSRAVNGKYLQSPRGVFEFRHFFSSHVSSSDGEAVSSRAIRALIREFVSGEPAEKPLSDSKIAALLAAKGYAVARRTVAKYREQEGIPAAALRKKI